MTNCKDYYKFRKTEDNIYPLTITSDRYGGTYSGGKYHAWNLEPWNVPEDIEADGDSGMDFWETNTTIVGIGNSVREAIEDLRSKLSADG